MFQMQSSKHQFLYLAKSENQYCQVNHLLMSDVWQPILFDIIIRLRSRRLHFFSKHSNLQLMRPLHLHLDNFLYPWETSVYKISIFSSAALISFCRELEHKGHISCMALLQASERCVQGNAVDTTEYCWWGVGCLSSGRSFSCSHKQVAWC